MWRSSLSPPSVLQYIHFLEEGSIDVIATASLNQNLTVNCETLGGAGQQALQCDMYVFVFHIDNVCESETEPGEERVGVLNPDKDITGPVQLR